MGGYGIIANSKTGTYFSAIKSVVTGYIYRKMDAELCISASSKNEQSQIIAGAFA